MRGQGFSRSPLGKRERDGHFESLLPVRARAGKAHRASFLKDKEVAQQSCPIWDPTAAVMSMDSRIPTEFHTYVASQEAETTSRLAGLELTPEEMKRYAHDIERAKKRELD